MRSCTLLRAGSLAVVIAACSSPSAKPWQVVGRDLPAALLSVWGTSSSDIYVAGGDRGGGAGPTVEHFDGTSWTLLPTGQPAGDLWWIFGPPGGPIFFGGEGGTILSYDGTTFTKMTTPGTGTVFGLWGTSADDMWAVGGAIGGANGAFAWRDQGGAGWVAAPNFPADLAASFSMWKIYGRATDDAWMVGTNGVAVQWDGTNLTESHTGAGSLFTVNADAERYVAVGGGGTGTVLENAGSGWTDDSPSGALPLVGVCLSDSHGAYVVGDQGEVYTRDSSGSWAEVDTGQTLDDETFHSVWIDPDGGTWAVGGANLLTLPPTGGILLHNGTTVPEGLL